MLLVFCIEAVSCNQSSSFSWSRAGAGWAPARGRRHRTFYRGRATSGLTAPQRNRVPTGTAMIVPITKEIVFIQATKFNPKSVASFYTQKPETMKPSFARAQHTAANPEPGIKPTFRRPATLNPQGALHSNALATHVHFRVSNMWNSINATGQAFLQYKSQEALNS